MLSNAVSISFVHTADIGAERSENGVRPHRDDTQANDDGSFDIYFGPEAPEEPESNWVQTIPDEGWFAAVRIYSPTDVAFD